MEGKDAARDLGEPGGAGEACVRAGLRHSSNGHWPLERSLTQSQLECGRRLIPDPERFHPGWMHRCVRDDERKTVSSKARRSTQNSLFPVHNANAMLRDGLSRLVRRSRCYSKSKSMLEHRWAIWMTYRNPIQPRVDGAGGIRPREPRESSRRA